MKNCNGVFWLPNKIITYLENAKAPFSYYVATFFSLLVIRSFIESFTQLNAPPYIDEEPFKLLLSMAHYYLAFASGGMLLSLLFFLATRVSIKKILMVILPCFAVILLAPCIDFIASFGAGHDLTYVAGKDVHGWHDLLLLFVTFFGKFSGISLGMRTEIILVLVASFCYFRIKSLGIFSALRYTLLVYALIFFYCTFPVYIELVISKLGFYVKYSSVILTRVYLVIILFSGIAIACIVNENIFIAVIKDMRWLRLLHYMLMLFLGGALTLNNIPISLSELLLQRDPTILINVFFSLVSIVFAALFSTLNNNIADIEIDKISNPSRPLVTGTLSLEICQRISYAAFALAVLYGIAAGVQSLYISLVIMAAYYIYSMPPIRFKRVFLFSKLVLSLNSLAIITLGYILFFGSTEHFPAVIVPIFLLGFTVASNFIDIKDYEGDLRVGILTLPTVLGLKKAKILIGAAFFFTYLSFYWLLNNRYCWIFLVLGGLTQAWLLNKNAYNEKQILIFHLTSIVFLIAGLLLL